MVRYRCWRWRGRFADAVMRRVRTGWRLQLLADTVVDHQISLMEVATTPGIAATMGARELVASQHEDTDVNQDVVRRRRHAPF